MEECFVETSTISSRRRHAARAPAWFQKVLGQTALTSAYRGRAAPDGALGRKIADWRRTVEQQWGQLRFGSVSVRAWPEGDQVEVELFLNGILSSRRPIGDYTARALPAHALASVPLECARIAWQR